MSQHKNCPICGCESVYMWTHVVCTRKDCALGGGDETTITPGVWDALPRPITTIKRSLQEVLKSVMDYESVVSDRDMWRKKHSELIDRLERMTNTRR